MRSLRVRAESNMATDDALTLPKSREGGGIQANEQTPSPPDVDTATDPLDESVHLAKRPGSCHHSNHTLCGCASAPGIEETRNGDTSTPLQPREGVFAHFSHQFNSVGVVALAVSYGPCDPTAALSYISPSLSGRKFDQCSTSFLAPGIWVTVGFCGLGFAGNTSAGTSNQSTTENPDNTFNTTRKPRGFEESVRGGGKTSRDYELSSDSDAPEVKRLKRSKAYESDCTDIAEPAGRPKREWTGKDEDRLQSYVERNVPWPETAKALKRSESAVTQHWRIMMGKEGRRQSGKNRQKASL